MRRSLQKYKPRLLDFLNSQTEWVDMGRVFDVDHSTRLCEGCDSHGFREHAGSECESPAFSCSVGDRD